MAEKEDKLVKLVAKLLELTQEGELVWESVKRKSDSEPSMTKTIGALFEAIYKDKTLIIYKREYDNTEGNSLLSYIANQSPYYTTVVLGFADDSGNLIWRFPRISGIDDLYQAVSYQVANIDSFIDEVFDDDF